MLNIVPLDFERLPVLINPAPAPGIPGDPVNPPARAAEPVAAVDTGLERHRPAANAGPDGPGKGTAAGAPEPLLSGQRLADLSWFFQLPDKIQNAPREQPEIGLQQVTGLYELPQETKETSGAALRISV